ncbi:MAG TPA: hypothetical protein DE179_13710 [Oceanospirillaceae bacterium]|nr:hypothetical protein [Oceanospirillaceae bacterium]
MLLPSSISAQVNANRGWSLIDILAVLAIVLLSGKLLLPNWAQGLSQAHLLQQHQSFLLHLRQARVAAQSYQQSVSLCGWLVATPCTNLDASQPEIISFLDINRDGVRQVDEKLVHRQSLHASLSLVFNRGAYVQFSAAGNTGQSGSWRLCWHGQPAGYKVVVSSSGALRSEKVACHG